MITREELVESIKQSLQFIEDPDDVYEEIDPDDVAFAVDLLKKALERAE